MFDKFYFANNCIIKINVSNCPRDDEKQNHLQNIKTISWQCLFRLPWLLLFFINYQENGVAVEFDLYLLILLRRETDRCRGDDFLISLQCLCCVPGVPSHLCYLQSGQQTLQILIRAASLAALHRSTAQHQPERERWGDGNQGDNTKLSLSHRLDIDISETPASDPLSPQSSESYIKSVPCLPPSTPTLLPYCQT